MGDFGNDLYVVSAVLALGFKGGVLRGRLYSAVGALYKQKCTRYIKNSIQNVQKMHYSEEFRGSYIISH